MFISPTGMSDLYDRLREWWSNWWAERRCVKCGSLWHMSTAHCPEHGYIIESMLGCPECVYRIIQVDVDRKARVAAEVKWQEREALADAIAEKIVEKLNLPQKKN